LNETNNRRAVSSNKHNTHPLDQDEAIRKATKKGTAIANLAVSFSTEANCISLLHLFQKIIFKANRI
jgi:hypothetical protein